MRVLIQRTPNALAIGGLVALALLTGLVVIESTLLGVLVILAAGGAILVTSLVDATAIRRTALAICWFIISYAAFLPRRASDQSYAEIGSLSDPRAQMQFAIILGLAAAGVWLWLSTPGSISAFLHAPLNLLGVYGGLIAISLIYAPDLEWAGFAALKLFEAVLVLAVLAVLVRTPGQLKSVIDVMLLGIGTVMLFFWFDIATGVAVADKTARFRTGWLHPNHASLMAFLFTSMMAARFFTATTLRQALVAVALTGLGAATSFMTAGKTGLVGAGIALGLTLLVTMFKRAGKLWTARVLLVAVSLAVVGGYFAASNIGIAAHLRFYETSQYQEASDLTGRVPLWSKVITQGLEHPFLGHGYMSTFAFTFDNDQGWTSAQAHNVFIQTFFDLGLAGLIIMVLLYTSVWSRLARQIVTLPAADERWARSVELLAALAMVTINSFTEDIFAGIFESRTMLFLIVVFAIYQNTRVVASEPATLDERSGEQGSIPVSLGSGYGKA
jgi:O-antigen ligase